MKRKGALTPDAPPAAKKSRASTPTAKASKTSIPSITPQKNASFATSTPKTVVAPVKKPKDGLVNLSMTPNSGIKNSSISTPAKSVLGKVPKKGILKTGSESPKNSPLGTPARNVNFRIVGDMNSPAMKRHLSDLRELTSKLHEVKSELRREGGRGSYSEETKYDLESAKLRAVNDVIAIITKAENSETTGCIQELCQFIDCLGKENAAIIEEVIKIFWADKPREELKIFESFYLSLLSYHPSYTRMIIRSTLKMFIPDEETKPKIELPLLHQNLHHFLKKYLKKLKGERKELVKQVISVFPFYKAHPQKVISFVKGLLEMFKYIPDRRSDILEIVFEKCIQIDASISRPQLKKFSSIKDLVTKGGEVEVDSGEGDSEDDYDEEEENVVLSDADKRLCESMDQCMDLLLGFIIPKSSDDIDETDKDLESGKEDEEGRTGNPRKELETDIKRIVLKLMKSHLISSDKLNCLQYTVFLLASEDKSFRSKMLSCCWDIFTTKTQHSIFRQAAISYLSGFLCRSKSAKNKIARKWLVKIINWIHDYLRLDSSNDLDYMNINLESNGAFYSACQAAFYLIAFRHADFVIDDDVSFLSNLELGSIISHPLNPLRAICAGIVREFSKVTAFYQVCYCKNVIMRNNRITLPVIGDIASASASTATKQLLDKYFPFDHYLLPRTKYLVAPHFREYEALVMSESEEDVEANDRDDGDGDDLLETMEDESGRQRRSSQSSATSRTRTISLTLISELNEI